MPKIIPIRDLRDTTKISELCNKTKEPIFITKNGYGDMVIMSLETYEQQLARIEIHDQIIEALKEVDNGEGVTAEEFMNELKEIYGE